jgi:hypothetical protein
VTSVRRATFQFAGGQRRAILLPPATSRPMFLVRKTRPPLPKSAGPFLVGLGHSDLSVFCTPIFAPLVFAAAFFLVGIGQLSQIFEKFVSDVTGRSVQNHSRAAHVTGGSWGRLSHWEPCYLI